MKGRSATPQLALCGWIMSEDLLFSNFVLYTLPLTGDRPSMDLVPTSVISTEVLSCPVEDEPLLKTGRSCISPLSDALVAGQRGVSVIGDTARR
jgi:hypothetical protein